MKAKVVDRSEGRRQFLLVFDTGDEVVTELTGFARREGIRGAQVAGVGALMRVVLGFFDVSRKDYRRIHVDGQVEVCSINGNLALVDGRPRLHAHIVVSSPDGLARGGHLLEGHVRPTLELTVSEVPEPWHRRRDEETGLPLLDPGL